MINLRTLILAVKDLKKVDRFLLICIISIVLFGIMMVYDASVFYANQTFGIKYKFLILQGVWITIGLIGAFVVSIIDLSLLKKYAGVIFMIALGFLFFILLPTPFAPAIYGARRWFFLNPSPLPKIPMIGIIGFQPSEFAKLAGVIFGASYFSKFSEKNRPTRSTDFSNFREKKGSSKSMNLLSRLLNDSGKASTMARNFIFITFFAGFLIAVEPDFTTAVILCVILLALSFMAEAPMKTLLFLNLPIAFGASLYAMSSSYRMDRIKTLFSPDSSDKFGVGYHIRQIMIALGSGGFLGLGFGNSRQKYAYLPEVIGDSIFAIVGEELGFIGAAILVSLFIFLLWRCFYIADHAKDKFESLLVKGITVWISMQALINLAAMVRLIPLTGVPLPLVSYGGSSTLFMLLGLGLILNVSKNIKHN